MKKYVLDTSVLGAYLQRRAPAVQLIHPFIQKHEVATSIIVYAEVTEYIKGLMPSRIVCKDVQSRRQATRLSYYLDKESVPYHTGGPGRSQHCM